MLILIDNYDSFTYNLYQYLRIEGCAVEVVRNDAASVSELMDRRPDGIVVSPGPGGPKDAGVSVELIRRAAGEVPLLGVCLGHQCLAAAYGASIARAPELRHGKTSPIHHDGDVPFKRLPTPFAATRYHSLIVERATLPSQLTVSAWTEDGLVMGLRHVSEPLFGVQFHPESILTTDGAELLRGFLAVVRSENGHSAQAAER